MKESTKYQYEKRIKSLEYELSCVKADLYNYKILNQEIFDAITEMVREGKQISHSWILSRFKRVFK